MEKFKHAKELLNKRMDSLKNMRTWAQKHNDTYNILSKEELNKEANEIAVELNYLKEIEKVSK